ncbi:hypothetical protein RhiJN_09283 [Ceratobasidium sp. AG-Ba]|nr:hypothetical protein RhiJN_09283 [Ceratobasidium sp. AG-Ba]QRW10042.1 hypothetical protein RhiLY_09041 [Ceratobasidium sp. AG-Ba]
MVQFSDVRLGHALAPQHKMLKRIIEDRGCTLYTGPAAGSTVDALQSFTITWDTSCASNQPSAIDIYLSAPDSAAASAIHVWKQVNFGAGTYTDVLKPKWWNSTTSVSLQLSFVESGTPLFLSSLPAGPSWNAKYDATAAATATGGAAAAIDTSTPDEVYQTVNNNFNGGGLNKGALAAAVIFPILAVAVALIVYVKFSRAKEAKKRHRWSQAMDKRMSVVSKDWVSQGRPSNVGSRNTRASSWFVQNMGGSAGRPSSTFATESGQAGIGARYGTGVHPSSIGSGPEMSQVRPRALSSLNASDRISRVSFAADSRPSLGDSLRPSHSHNTPTRAFHRATIASDDMEMSPTQTSGPFPLSADDIRAKVAQGQEHGRPSVDGELRDDILKMPAATHLRTGQNSSSEDFILRPESMALAYDAYDAPGVSVEPPPPAAHSAMSPVGTMPMLPPSASPDAMMHAYAQARNGPSPAGSQQGMRTLYAPSNSSNLSPSAAEDRNPYRKSTNSEISAYSETSGDHTVGKAA